MTTGLRTQDERRAIVEDVQGKIRAYGVNNPEDHAPIKKLYDIMEQYIHNEQPSGFSGKIPFPDIDRAIDYQFPMRRSAQAHVRMVPLTAPPRDKTGARKLRRPTKAQLAALKEKAQKDKDG